MGGGTPELAHAGGGHPLGEGDQPELTLQTRTADIIFTNEMFFSLRIGSTGSTGVSRLLQTSTDIIFTNKMFFSLRIGSTESTGVSRLPYKHTVKTERCHDALLLRPPFCPIEARIL